MGCVFGKAAAGENRRRQSGSSQTRWSVVENNKLGESNRDGEVRVRKDVERERNRDAGAAAKAKPALGTQAGLGWPAWLCEVAGDAVNDWTPRRANTFEKLEKIGQGTYSNVYKAKDLITGKIVALKKVRCDNLEPESLKFMAREIIILRKLDHPNVIKLEGLATSRMSSSLYLVFEYMEHDLSGLAACQKFTEPQTGVDSWIYELYKHLSQSTISRESF